MRRCRQARPKTVSYTHARRMLAIPCNMRLISPFKIVFFFSRPLYLIVMDVRNVYAHCTYNKSILYTGCARLRRCGENIVRENPKRSNCTGGKIRPNGIYIVIIAHMKYFGAKTYFINIKGVSWFCTTRVRTRYYVLCTPLKYIANRREICETRYSRYPIVISRVVVPVVSSGFVENLNCLISIRAIVRSAGSLHTLLHAVFFKNPLTVSVRTRGVCGRKKKVKD